MKATSLPKLPTLHPWTPRLHQQQQKHFSQTKREDPAMMKAPKLLENLPCK